MMKRCERGRGGARYCLIVVGLAGMCLGARTCRIGGCADDKRPDRRRVRGAASRLNTGGAEIIRRARRTVAGRPAAEREAMREALAEPRPAGEGGCFAIREATTRRANWIDPAEYE